MGKNRFNVIPTPVDYTPKGKKKEEEIKLIFPPCHVCNSAIGEGSYGRFTLGNDTIAHTCSGVCDRKQRLKSKEYPNDPARARAKACGNASDECYPCPPSGCDKRDGMEVGA